MTTQLFPEQTIRYKTFAKRTLTEALGTMFKGHPDELIQGTRATIEYPKSEIEFPCVIVRFFEREIFNAGVGHQEVFFVTGESDSIEVSVSMPTRGTPQISWPQVANATGYKVYRGTASNQENRSFTTTDTSFTDKGSQGTFEAVPTVVTATLDAPQPAVTVGPPIADGLGAGDYFYRVTATAPSEAVKFGHYFYNADIELAVYALSSLDRDHIADSLVQTIAMGKLDQYTDTFFQRVYPPNDLYPDSQFHFINVNADQIQGFGETQMQVPWASEDDLMYATSYRFGVFGELYSLPPKLTYALVQKITEYPYVEGIDPIPEGRPGEYAEWQSNSIQTPF